MLQKTEFKKKTTDSNLNIEVLSTHFENVCVLDSNPAFNTLSTSKYAKLVAIGSLEELIISSSENIFNEFEEFYTRRKGWLFGYFSYDLKNRIEKLYSENDDKLGFPVLHFFAPKVVLQISETEVTCFYDDEFVSDQEVNEIYDLSFSTLQNEENRITKEIAIHSKITKAEYVEAVTQLKKHIHKGDIYEVNFCYEYFAENAIINPPNVFEKLNEISSAPFSAYCKFNNRHLLCASPERFLRKEGNKLISQPIKGTSKRSENKEEDEQLKESLKTDAKERSENVMIVDLVRNDLSKVAKRSSVKVDELFGIYSFKQVHQMISTISCELKESTSFSDIIKSTFPPGSMTGAPKVSAMKLIEQYESTKRGLYSGALGYITPEGDFDFNVVIRSILYNSEKNYLSFMVGSAITEKADAEKEYNECLLKAKAMFDVLENKA